MKSPLKNTALLPIILFTLFFVQSPIVLGQYHFDSWTTDNGLPQNGVRAITQTPDGYLWFTTFDGLVRFDGVKFTTFNKGNTPGIINNRFTGIHSNKDGTLYATTSEDGVLTVYKNGVFKSYDSDEVPESYISHIETDENNEPVFQVIDEHHEIRKEYYLRDGKFVFKKDVKDWYTDEFNFEGRSGRIWTLTKDQVIEKQDEEVTVYPYRIEKFSSRLEVYEDRHGGLWVGGSSLTHFKHGQVENFDGKYKFPFEQSDYHHFWEEEDGSLWFANGGKITSGIGLVRYKDGVFSSYGEKEGLTATNIQTVFRDREDNVWLGTGRGLNRLKKSVIRTLSVADGLMHPEVYPLYRDSKNSIWIGMLKGINIYRNGKIEKIDLGNGWDARHLTVQSFFEDSNGKMWIGIAGGTYIYENKSSEHLKSAEWKTPYSILQDRKGDVWMATDKGILQYRDYKLVKSYTVADGLPKEFTSVVFEDSKGNLWFGGFGGLSKLENGKFINYTKKHGLAGDVVRTIFEDKEGILWIGTYDEGLSRFKDGEFVNFKKENGLYSNGVFAIEEDERGHFWITSNQGIYRVSKKSLNDFAAGRSDRIFSTGYNKSDGMLNIECNGGRQPASIRDENGHFWFPTQDGIAIVDPEAERFNSKPPSVVIESATVERKKVNIRNGLIVEPGQKNIEIKYTGISLIKSDQINFKYKLVGHDAKWIDAGTKRTAYYSHLPPGEYKFLVKASNSDGIWNEQGDAIDVALQPFFYQTYWFYGLCLMIVILILFVVWRLSIYQLKVREKHLAKLVEEKTVKLQQANEELQLQANSDGLTAIGNRRRFEEFLADEWHRAIRFKTEISLILIDIDHFKLFNDTYGHLEGDECLKQVAKALTETIHRPTDLVARFGGEEFAIILGGTDAEGALVIAEEAFKNVENLEITHRKSETDEYLTVSVGIATTFAKLGMTEAELIQTADEALYEAKENGRKQIITKDLTEESYTIPPIKSENPINPF